MYARIKSTRTLYQSLSYNEEKVSDGRAECLLAENFAKDLEQLTKKDKLFQFRRFDELNQQADKKIFHISLNFHPADRLLADELRDITKEYMQRMGLGKQPYLMYEHTDVAHPHVHIVASAIGKDGRKIRVDPKGILHSKKISRELEQSHSLIVYGKGMTPEQKRQLNQAQKINYGQKPTMPALSHVINRVVPNYRYTSLEELNAVLGLYNVEAFRGGESSWIYQHRGLLYRVLDDKGHPIGVAIKASLFESRPILARLEERYAFSQSESLRPQHRQRVTSAIDWTLLKSSLTLNAFGKALEKERISAVFKRDSKGTLQQIYYVDHQNKSVFDGAMLGGRYTAAAMRERCIPEQEHRQELVQTPTRELMREQIHGLIKEQTQDLMREQPQRQRQRQHQQEQELEIGEG